MSKLFVDEIHPKSSSTISITGYTPPAGSNIKEQLAMLGDGGSYTVPSGIYTSQNVTTEQNFTSTFVDLTGSSVAYTPPTGTTMVKYQFIFLYAYSDAYSISHFRLMVDADEVTTQRTTLSTQSIAQWQQTLTYLLPIGGTADTTTGRQATWTAPKTLKVQAREYASTHEGRAHRTVHWNGTGQNNLQIPKLIITALG